MSLNRPDMWRNSQLELVQRTVGLFLKRAYYEMSVLYYHALLKRFIMTLTVRLDASIDTALTQICSSQSLTKSQVVHKALDSWFAAQSAQQGHALLAFVPPAALTPKRTRSKPQPGTDAYKPYSKATLRTKVLAAQAGKRA